MGNDCCCCNFSDTGNYVTLKSKVINCCNGGRYDKLISDLGAKKQTPAVGAALNLIY